MKYTTRWSHVTQRTTPGSAIVRKTVSGPSISKYDLVAMAIPAAYLLVGPAVVAGVPVHLALVAASAVATVVMGYALFVDPPTGVDRRRYTPTGQSTTDTAEERRTARGRSGAS